jgi:hypothetical protein
VDAFLSDRRAGTARMATPRCVQVPTEEQPDPDPADILVLWPLLSSLPPRDRVVLVLRCHEQLTDVQIGDLVHRPPGLVASVAASALAVLDEAAPSHPEDPSARLEQDLREVADTRALPVVDPEVLAGLAATEKAWRRKRLLTAGALVAVLVLAFAIVPDLATGGGAAQRARPARHPASLAQLAAGPQTRLPWWAGGELHLEGRVLPTNHQTVVYAGGTTLVGDYGVEDDHPHAAWWYVDGRRLLPLASSSRGVFKPVVAPRGDLVAWASPAGATHEELVLWSTASRHAVGMLRLRVHVHCCADAGAVDLRGIDSQGRVLFSTSGAVRTWQPGHRVQPIRGIASALYDLRAWPGGVSWRPYDNDRLGPFPVAYGILDARGRLHEEGTTPEQSLWSPDGSRYAWTVEPPSPGAPGPDRVRVRHVITAHTSTMRLPADASYQLVGWESPVDLVVAVHRDTGRPLRGSDLPDRVQLLRCHVDSGACETAGLASESILALSSAS